MAEARRLGGLSDSPYSLRAIGERLHAEGYRVLGLRLPGHGTAPSELRGERGLPTVGAADLMRLRHNPFYAYQERRALEFLAAP